jgi:hypothetical protein
MSVTTICLEILNFPITRLPMRWNEANEGVLRSWELDDVCHGRSRMSEADASPSGAAERL